MGPPHLTSGLNRPDIPWRIQLPPFIGTLTRALLNAGDDPPWLFPPCAVRLFALGCWGLGP